MDITDDNTRPKPEHEPPTFRKLLRLGHSTAITLPPAWVRDHFDETHRITEVIIHPDGRLSVRPFHEPHADSGIQERAARLD